MAKKRVLVCYGVGIDAIAGWLGSYKGRRLQQRRQPRYLVPLISSRRPAIDGYPSGYWAGTVGVRQLLKLFEKYKITASWFIPGHSLETFPEECAIVRDTGHEIGLHGYLHENPIDMSLEQQRDILDKTYRQLTDFCRSKPPRGTVASWWEVSREATELLLSYGIKYDHSMSHEDCQPYYLRAGDTGTKIDYGKKAEHWMKPLVKG
jgi:peptidoglycan/xylan/chitin deacetylase (PgdA/CDA1 family)